MRVEQVRTILKREYLTRIKSKAFWITTPDRGITISAPVHVMDREAEGW